MKMLRLVFLCRASDLEIIRDNYPKLFNLAPPHKNPSFAWLHQFAVFWAQLCSDGLDVFYENPLQDSHAWLGKQPKVGQW